MGKRWNGKKMSHTKNAKDRPRIVPRSLRKKKGKT